MSYKMPLLLYNSCLLFKCHLKSLLIQSLENVYFYVYSFFVNCTIICVRHVVCDTLHTAPPSPLLPSPFQIPSCTTAGKWTCILNSLVTIREKKICKWNSFSHNWLLLTLIAAWFNLWLQNIRIIKRLTFCMFSLTKWLGLINIYSTATWWFPTCQTSYICPPFDAWD